MTHLFLYLMAQAVQSIACLRANGRPHFMHLSPWGLEAQALQRYAMFLENTLPQMMHFSWFTPIPQTSHSFAFVLIFDSVPFSLALKLCLSEHIRPGRGAGKGRVHTDRVPARVLAGNVEEDRDLAVAALELHVRVVGHGTAFLSVGNANARDCAVFANRCVAYAVGADYGYGGRGDLMVVHKPVQEYPEVFPAVTFQRPHWRPFRHARF